MVVTCLLKLFTRPLRHLVAVSEVLVDLEVLAEYVGALMQSRRMKPAGKIGVQLVSPPPYAF